jgi:hypothetical protein
MLSAPLACAGFAVALVRAEIGLRLVRHDGVVLQVQWGMPDDAVEKRARQRITDHGRTLSYEIRGTTA